MADILPARFSRRRATVENDVQQQSCHYDKLQEFHPFIRLPTEIQIMIWSWYRELRSVRHLFGYSRDETLIYGAQDTWSGHKVIASIEKGTFITYLDSLLLTGKPETSIIHDCASVAGADFSSAYATVDCRGSYEIQPFFSTDFSRDVFVFCNNGTSRSSIGFFQWLGPDLDATRWVFKIQNLGLVPRGNTVQFLSQLDIALLGTMQDLKTVYVINKCNVDCQKVQRKTLRAAKGDFHGFTSQSEFIDAHWDTLIRTSYEARGERCAKETTGEGLEPVLSLEVRPESMGSPCACRFHVSGGLALQRQLKRVFDKLGRRVDVEVVVDWRGA